MNLSPSIVAQQLREGTLPERERLHYLLVVLFAPVLEDVTRLGDDPAHYPLTDPVMDIILTVMFGLGVLSCYRENERGDGRYFADRFFCLSLPVGFWLVPAWLAGFFILDGVLAAGHVKVAVENIWNASLTVAFCLRMRHFIRVVSTTSLEA